MDDQLLSSPADTRKARDLSEAEVLAARVYHARLTADVELMDLVAEVERYELYVSSGYECTEAWLATYLGMGCRKSLEYVQIAVGLHELPLMREGYRTGVLSYDHLRALIQVITPDNESQLVKECKGLSVSDTFHMVDQLKHLDAVDSQIARSDRFLEMNWDKDRRVLMLNGWLPEDAGAKVEKAIDVLAEKIPDEPGREATPMAAKRADALCQMAGAVITEHPAKATVVVHVDAETLATNEGAAQITGGPMVSPETAIRLLCDGNQRLVVDLADGTYRELGRQTSTVTKKTRRQVLERTGAAGCPAAAEEKSSRFITSNGARTVADTRSPPYIWLDHPFRPTVRMGPPTLVEETDVSGQPELQLATARGPGPDP